MNETTTAPRLSARQRRTLTWLADTGGWRAPWRGDRPGYRWPDELPMLTFRALLQRDLIQLQKVLGSRQEHFVRVTEEGQRALS